MYKIIIIAFLSFLFSKETDTLNTKKSSYNSLSLAIGTATKDLNLLQITYNRKLYKNTEIYGFLGLPTFMGYGISWQQYYNKNSWVLSSGSGWNPFIGSMDGAMHYLNIMYQWQLSNSSAFLSTGIQINISEYTHNYYDTNNIFRQNLIWKFMPYPIISIDWKLFSDIKKKNYEDNKRGKNLEMIVVLFIVSIILLASM